MFIIRKLFSQSIIFLDDNLVILLLIISQIYCICFNYRIQEIPDDYECNFGIFFKFWGTSGMKNNY